jgi:DNA invertase Pin-like site-specific DNA recombinase
MRAIPVAGKVAVYLRQSLDRDGNQLAVSRQRQACLELCRRNGWTDTMEYVDNDQSASTGHRREYQQMLADIESGAIGAVVCYHLDRLHRQPKELETFIDLADTARVQLATVTGDVDLSTDQGRLVARIMGAVARAEVERKSARQKAANQQKANNGKAWAMRSFGYNGDKLNKREADLIRQASQDLLNGASLYGIAQQWNSAGVTTTKGELWTGTGVRQVLIRPRNAGLQVYGVRAASRAAKGHSLKDKISSAIIEGAKVSWPAIVDRDTFDLVLSHLSDPKRHSGKKRARVYLLSGLAVCGVCGHKVGTSMRTTKAGAKRPVYQCSFVGCGKVSRDVSRTDQVVVDIITGRLARPDAAALFATKTVDTKALAEQANKFRSLIRAAEREYDQGDIKGVDLKRRRDRLQPQIDALEAQIVGASTSRKLDGLMGNAKAREIFDGLPLDRQREVIRTVATVTVKPSEKLGGVFDPTEIRVEPRQDI